MLLKPHLNPLRIVNGADVSRKRDYLLQLALAGVLGGTLVVAAAGLAHEEEMAGMAEALVAHLHHIHQRV